MREPRSQALRMHLVVFDVDGTLTDTNAMGPECFWQAAREVLRLPPNHSQWLDEVEHYTDLGIASQHCKVAFGRDMMDSEIDLLKRRLVASLEAALLANAECIRAMPGAADVLAAIGSRSDCCAAIATGCFLASAEFILRKARLFDGSISLAGCDDAPSREAIMLSAAREAGAKHGCQFSAITYVGDGVWDIRAARNLGWGFIGIANGDGAEQLRRAGASTVLRGFEPVTEFLDEVSRSTTNQRYS
jgi:phosphoglycolate phosphatase-like HAD superfamily hydrolase